MRLFVVLMLVALAAGAIWSAGIEPGLLRQRAVEIETASLPANAAPLRIVVVSDLHVGSPHISLDRVDAIVRRINALGPDLILIAGDFVGTMRLWSDPPAPSAIAARLAGLRSRLGVVAVLGNHDWMPQGRGLAAALTAAGIRVLENENLRLDTTESALWIAGIADDKSRRPDIPAAFHGIPRGAAVIALTHDPAVFPDVPDRAIITIAGHTHGGQVNLPFIGPIVNSSRAPLRHSYGLIEEEGRRLYVSAGVGTSVLPIRFNRPPEFTILTLRGTGSELSAGR